LSTSGLKYDAKARVIIRSVRDELNERQWARLLPLLPPQKPPRGRPAKDHRTVLNAILWVMRTGAPWRDLPADAGVCWKTVASRFYRWTDSGVWGKILAELQRDADENGGVAWSKQYVDGSSVRAHQHAAGAKGSDGEKEALGRSRGGFSTKFHVKADGEGKPLALIVTPGQRHESKVFESLMEASAGGTEGRRPETLLGDKGYSYRGIRLHLARRGIRAVIPLRSDQGEDPGFDRAAYRERNRVERLVGRLKQWRRVATRYEKRASNYLAVLMLASIVVWL
jgi:transposase